MHLVLQRRMKILRIAFVFWARHKLGQSLVKKPKKLVVEWDERGSELINESWDRFPAGVAQCCSVEAIKHVPIIFINWGHAHRLFCLLNGGGLRCCLFPTASFCLSTGRRSPLPRQIQWERWGECSVLCNLGQFSKNYVRQQLQLIGLTLHWHWRGGGDMIYFAASWVGGRMEKYCMVWCISSVWLKTSRSIGYYSKRRYFAHPENLVCCHAAAETTTLLVLKWMWFLWGKNSQTSNSLCFPKFYIKIDTWHITIIFVSSLKSFKSVSADIWKAGDMYRSFQHAHASSQYECR